MKRSRIDPATPAKLRTSLTKLQQQMQNLWDSWHSWEIDYPAASAAAKERFEEMEVDETILLDLLKNPKEDGDGEIPEEGGA